MSAEPHYKRWYKTKRWQMLRWSILVRDLFTCAICGKVEGNTSRMVADHIKAHKGDEALFWNPDNLQCLCASCHSGHKQSIEKGGKGKQQIGLDGWPVDRGFNNRA